MSDTPSPSPDPGLQAPPKKSGWRLWAAALGAGLVYGLGLYLMVEHGAPDSGMVLVSFLFGAPIGACVLASLIAHKAHPRTLGGHVSIAMGVITAILIGGVVFLRETAICLVIASPIFYAAGAVTGVVMDVVLRSRAGRGLACISLLAPLLLWPIEAAQEHPREDGVVVTVIDIDASPAEVWAHTVEIPAIAPSELKPTFSHMVAGVPQPIDAVMRGSGEGAVRDLRWQGGVTFQEHVTDWRKDERLSWRFVFAPDSIPAGIERHIRLDGDYLRLTEGDYVLTPLADGRTRLTLTTRYWVATPINGYCHWWAKRFLNDFHGVVLNVIKDRAETASARSV